MEEWRTIKGFDTYQVSNLGRIKSSNYRKLGLEHILKQVYVKGYKSVNLSKGTTRATVYVHRIVAETFIQNPENLPQVHHINGENEDNRVENLRWGHIRDRKKRKGTHSGIRILAINIDTKKETEFVSLTECGRKFNISRSSISRFFNGELRRVGRYTFKKLEKEENNAKIF